MVLSRTLACLVVLGWFIGSAPIFAESNHVAAVKEVSLKVLGREVMVFRTAVGPYEPEQRAAAADALVHKLLAAGSSFKVTTVQEGGLTQVCVNGKTVFSIAPGDVSPVAGETQEAVTSSAVQKLELVLAESGELRDKRRLLITLVKLVIVTVVSVALVWLLGFNRRWLDSWLLRLTAQKAGEIKSHALRTVGLKSVAPVLRGATAFLFWVLAGLLCFLWLQYALRLFPQTRAFGEELGGRLFRIFEGFGASTLHSVPGLVVVILIWLSARLMASAARRYFNGIVQGRIKSAHFDQTSAQVTQRLSVVAIWLVAVIIAFPYIPGSHSPAFQGIGVLGGLMLSLGASSVITQWVNGLILVYNRTCQIGDYVKVGEFEGTLMSIGFSTSRLLSPRNEEIILPNSQLTGGSFINYTRQNATLGVIVPVTVTIGYDTPWRQVHAMLIEAARRTAGLKPEPKPEVFQTQLSDFYVGYELRVSLAQPAQRVLVVAALNANIQDVFNEYGVQILSPHFMANPPVPAVVPREKWHLPPATPA